MTSLLKRARSTALNRVLITRVLTTALTTSLLCLSAQLYARSNPVELVPAESSYLFLYEGETDANLLEQFELPEPTSFKAQSSPSERFVQALYGDLVKHSKEGTISALGLLPLKDSSYMLFGLGLWPVLDFSISSQKKLASWVAQHAKSVGFTLTAEGKRLVHRFEGDGDTWEVSLALYAKDRARLSVTPQASAQKLTPHLMGQAPASNFSAQLKAITEEAQLEGSSLFWVSFERLAATLLGRGEGLNHPQYVTQKINKLVQSLPTSCADEYLQLTSHTPEMISGLRSRKDNIERLFTRIKLSPQVASGPKKLNGSDMYVLSDEGAIASFSLSVNVKAIIEIAQDRLTSLKSHTFTCPHLTRGPMNPATLTRAQSQLAMLPAFAQQLRGVSFALYQDKPITEAAVAVSAVNTPALLEILKGMSPQAQAITLPKAGAPAEPFAGLPLPPNVGKQLIQVTEQGIAIGAGAKGHAALATLMSKPALAEAPFMSVSYDLDAILGAFRSFLERSQQAMRQIELRQAQQKARAEGREPPQSLPPKEGPLSSLKNVKLGRGRAEVRFTEHGLEIDTWITRPSK